MKDKLVPLLEKDKANGFGFRQGVVVSWNQLTAENTVSIGGTVFTNLPILNTTEAALLAPGDVVSILTGGPTWMILGRVTIPGTPEAVSALSSLKIQSNSVAASETTTSGTPTDLATVGPSVDIVVPASGRVLVFISCQSYATAPNIGGAGVSTGEATMTYSASGANTISTSLARAYDNQIRDVSTGAGIEISNRLVGTRVNLHEGLNPGLTTFIAKYYTLTGNSATFLNRNITVMAI